MSDYITVTLRDGSEALARAVMAPGPAAIRTRGDQRRRRRLAGSAAAVLAVLVVGGGYPLARNLAADPTAARPTTAGIVVPRVTGETLPAARRAILRAGLSVGTVTQRRSDSIAPNLVIGTWPGAGTTERARTPVGLVVSADAVAVVVPSVLAMTEHDAVAILGQAGFLVRVVAITSGASAPGLAMAQSPAAGSRVARGAEITLYVVAARSGG